MKRANRLYDDYRLLSSSIVTRETKNLISLIKSQTLTGKDKKQLTKEVIQLLIQTL